jgi:arginyl-tRNA synthetase
MAIEISQTNIFSAVALRIQSASTALISAGHLPAGIDLSRITVEPPRDASHGDMATNAAMVFAKDAGKKPRELAEKYADALRGDGLFAKVDIAGPGFINLTLKPAAWTSVLREAVRLGAQYGKNDIGHGVPVNVEYVSANPTGPMHVGHGRGAVFGDALANLLEFTASKSRANITSTMRVRRSMCSRVPPISATARRSARTRAPYPRDFIPVSI